MFIIEQVYIFSIQSVWGGLATKKGVDPQGLKIYIYPNDFNNYFISIAANILSNMAETVKAVDDIRLKSKSFLNFWLATTKWRRGILGKQWGKVIQNLSNYPALDLYDIYNNFIKRTRESILPILTDLINKPINTGIFPGYQK